MVVHVVGTLHHKNRAVLLCPECDEDRVKGVPDGVVERTDPYQKDSEATNAQKRYFHYRTIAVALGAVGQRVELPACVREKVEDLYGKSQRTVGTEGTRPTSGKLWSSATGTESRKTELLDRVIEMDQLRKMRRKVWLLQNITSEPTSMCDDALITESWAAERSAWHLRNYISLGTYISYIPLISSWYPRAMKHVQPRKNPLLPKILLSMGQALSLHPCLRQTLEGPKRWSHQAWLEQRCRELQIENEQLRAKLRERDALQKGSPPSALSRQKSGAMYSSFKKTTSFKGEVESPNVTNSDLCSVAVAAAAESTAEYQRSQVKVTIDNESLSSATAVVVRTPHRRRLLADMSNALAGLGLIVNEASCTTNKTFAVSRFVLQEGANKPRKVLESERLKAIEQRLQQRFTCAHGIKGGVRRLVSERFIRALPPWEHEGLPPIEGEDSFAPLALEMLSRGLRGSSSLGELAPALASKLAAELLCEMTRMRCIGPITSEQTAGEWILLLENRGACTVSSSAPSSGGSERTIMKSESSTSLDSLSTSASTLGTPPRTEEDGEGDVPLVGISRSASDAEGPSRVHWLEPGSILWEMAHAAPVHGAGEMASALPPPILSWIELLQTKSSEGEDGVVVRAVHLSTARSRLAELKESMARERAHVLAETPVFAPFSTDELLGL
ncbi:MAG: hypothetical protein SGPRY_004503, partial [Prymnesium sp.]